MSHIPIKNKPNLVRDAKTGAIFNTDVASFILHKKEKEAKQQIQDNKKEINNIKSELIEMKEMLKTLLER